MSLAATATMVLMLLLLAGFWLLQAGLVAGVAYVEEKVEIVADLRDVPGAEAVLVVQAHALAADVAAMPEVRDGPLRLEGRGAGDASGSGCASAARWTSPATSSATRCRRASR